jgi:hypothetical protein
MLILPPAAAAAAAVADAAFALSGDFAALPLLAVAVVLAAVVLAAAVAAAAVLSGDSGIRPSSDGLGGSGGLAQPSLPGGKLYSCSNSSNSDGEVNTTVIVQDNSQYIIILRAGNNELTSNVNIAAVSELQ